MSSGSSANYFSLERAQYVWGVAGFQVLLYNIIFGFIKNHMFVSQSKLRLLHRIAYIPMNIYYDGELYSPCSMGFSYLMYSYLIHLFLVSSVSNASSRGGTPTEQPETFLTESKSTCLTPRDEIETAVQSIEDIESIE